MKKIFAIFAVLCLLLLPCQAFAAEETAPEAPKLIVTGVAVPGDELAAGESAGITVTIKNMSHSSAAMDIRIALSDAQGGITRNGSGYIREIRAGREAQWTMNVNVLPEAADGNHALTLTMDYSAGGGVGGTSSETINVKVSGIKTTAESTDKSQPRAMVTGCDIGGGFVSPGSSTAVTVKIKNTSAKKAMKSIKLAFAEESGELICDGLGTAYLPLLGAGNEYAWVINLTAANTAKSGEHKATITAEYEDDDGTQLTSSDTVRIPVRQSVSLEYSGAALPAKLVQGDSSAVSVVFMNTGKSTIYNCIMQFDVEGVNSGGSILIGTIAAGESKSGTANLRPDSGILGEVSGALTISYEDDYGEKYSESIEVSSTVTEKAVAASADETKENRNPLWWLFLLLGLAVGGAAGAGIPLAIISRKRRLEDEKRL